MGNEQVGKIVVVKYGGSAIEGDANGGGEVDPVILDILALKKQGLQPVVVHGGGKAITKLLERLGHAAQWVDGLRVTDETTMEVVEMVLGGQVNKQLVAAFLANGCPAVGLTGVDGGLLQVKQKQHPKGDLGWVGKVQSVKPDVVLSLLQSGFLPVIAPIGVDGSGARYNVNADSAAGAIAGALQAEKMVLLTDVPGIMAETAAGRAVLPEVTPATIEALLADGTIHGGMVPKVEACLEALKQGAQHVHIVNAKEPHALLAALSDEAQVGTIVHPEHQEEETA